MAKSGKEGLDRIQREPSESELANMMMQQMAEQAWPGIFAGGKEIVRTEAVAGTGKTPAEMTLWFNDNSAIKIVGEFVVRYKQPDGTELMVSEHDIIEASAKRIEESDEEPD